jgi:hypothetical protein
MFSEVSFLSDWINVVNSEAVLKNFNGFSISINLTLRVGIFIITQWKVGNRKGLNKRLKGHCVDGAKKVADKRALPTTRVQPVFLNVYGVQESIPRNEFRQPM